MFTYTQRRRIVKPAECQCDMIFPLVVPYRPHYSGCSGFMVLNDTDYYVSAIYEWTNGERTVIGYAIEKKNGEIHNVCLVAGRLECTCGDWIWRRERESKPHLLDCKHCKAVRQLLPLPVDLKPQPKRQPSQVREFDGP